jgi:nucleotide-binding universal stress UspA family protein
LLEADFSEAILPHAQVFAQLFASEILLLNVVIPLELRQRVAEPRLVDSDEELVEAAAYRAQQYLDMIRTSRVAATRTVTTRVEVAPSAAEAIQNVSDESPTSVIAMATHARRGVARLLFGSVADKVVRGTSRCVLLFRPD